MSKTIIFTDRTDSTLDAYLRDISKYKILSNPEINELILEAQAGNKASRDKVIQSNLRFVVTVAKKFQNRGVPLMDLISEGNCGLAYSIDKFDVTKNVPFIAYAVHWIKQYIYQSIYWTGKEIRLPISQQVKVIKLLKATKEFQQNHDRAPSTEELSELTGISTHNIDFLAQFANRLVSVDDFIGGDSENNQVCDIIPDNEPPIDLQIDDKNKLRELESVLSKLPIREHDIICLLFGIGMEPLDSKSVADLYGIGTERVRQIKESGLKRLRERFGNKIKSILL